MTVTEKIHLSTITWTSVSMTGARNQKEYVVKGLTLKEVLQNFQCSLSRDIDFFLISLNMNFLLHLDSHYDHSAVGHMSMSFSTC